jgi:hypothetical protein
MVRQPHQRISLRREPSVRSYCSSGKRYRTKHPVQITLLQTIRCPDVTENQGNASFNLPGNAYIWEIRTVHHQVMSTRKQKKPPSISTHSRTRQKRLQEPMTRIAAG